MLVLFDFDGTLTSKDSLPDFIRYAVGLRRFLTGFLSLAPTIAAYKLGWLSNHEAKERIITGFFGGWPAERFDKIADNYSLGRLEQIIRPLARQELQRYRDNGDHVVIVSASIENWLRKWCERYGVELISTRLQVRDGIITGRFAGANCHGPEKVARIKERIDLSVYDSIHAYGDSRGDAEMLDLATRAYYRHFH